MPTNQIGAGWGGEGFGKQQCAMTIEGNWIATGRKMQHDFEVYGTKGALAFSQEHFNVLNYFSTADAKGRQGFRRIEA